MFVKTYNTPQGPLVAACDAELLGKKLKEGVIVLDLDKHAGFYKGERTNEEKLCELLLQSGSANLVGEKSVGCAISAGLAQKSDIRRINGVSHLVILRI
jgi:hypothetical protein